MDKVYKLKIEKKKKKEKENTVVQRYICVHSIKFWKNML
jgi:hypothetical protein